MKKTNTIKMIDFNLFASYVLFFEVYIYIHIVMCTYVYAVCEVSDESGLIFRSAK